MNRELKNRIFDVPQNVLDKINHTVVGLQGKHAHGLQRAKKILTDKNVKYGQLKRIIHDLQNIDTNVNRVRYDLAGGDDMLKWGKQFLKGERDLISNRKDSRMRADEIGGIDGDRKNSHLKKHNKKFDFSIPTNLIKSNSHKNSISPIKFGKLFEEVEKIKKLML